MTTLSKHPAPFNDAILRRIAEELPHPRMTIFDPFCGIGKVHMLRMAGHTTFGVELEPEWATQQDGTIVANALHLPFPDRSFDAICTSPVFGNRMSDSHNAQERCKPCGGMGDNGEFAEKLCGVWTCRKCNGQGKRSYTRITYRHKLGRPLHPDNSGQLHWGPSYKTFHHAAWREISRVARDYFFLNVADHMKLGEIIPVTAWHRLTLEGLGWRVVKDIEIETPGMRFGANRDARVGHEHLLVMERAA